MKEPCDHCGELQDITFMFQGDWQGDRFIMRFCKDCGMKILQKIREGVN